ncbi:MAG: hypothetical protein Q6373_004240, partial [Candidatus Sigynarchaeota archaeon]
EHGHANHLRNEVSSVAYWYAEVPTPVKEPPPVEKRMPVLKVDGKWVFDPKNQITSREIPLTDEMKKSKRRWKAKDLGGYINVSGKLCIDEGGFPCIEMKIYRDNPNLYQIPIADLLEEFLNKPAEVELVGGKQPQLLSGMLVLQPGGELVVETRPNQPGTLAEATTIKDLVSGYMGALVEIEGIGDLDKIDETTGKPKAYKITFQVKK